MAGTHKHWRSDGIMRSRCVSRRCKCERGAGERGSQVTRIGGNIWGNVADVRQMLGGSDGGGAQEQQSKREGIVITPTSLPLAPDRGDSCIEVYGRWRQTLENPIYLRRTIRCRNAASRKWKSALQRVAGVESDTKRMWLQNKTINDEPH